MIDNDPSLWVIIGFQLILLIGIVIGAIFISVLIENDLMDQYIKTEKCEGFIINESRVTYVIATSQETERLCRTNNITLFEINKVNATIFFEYEGTNVSRRDVTINEACIYYQQLNQQGRI